MFAGMFTRVQYVSSNRSGVFEAVQVPSIVLRSMSFIALSPTPFCQAFLQSVRPQLFPFHSFVSFGRSCVLPSFGRLVVASLLRYFVASLLRCFVASSLRRFVASPLRRFVASSLCRFVASFVASSLRRFVASSLRRFVASSLRRFDERRFERSLQCCS